MNSQINPKPNTRDFSGLKKIAIGILRVIVIFVILICGLVAFALWGGGGEPATLDVAIHVGQSFVTAIHNQKIDIAQSMLSEKYIVVSNEDFSTLVTRNEHIFGHCSITTGLKAFSW